MKTPDTALAALEAYRGRDEHVLDICGLGGVHELSGRLVVVETLEVDATTDFGAPSAISALDRRPLQGAPTSSFFAVILQGCWLYLDDVAARTTTPLRKGPRGGGRDVEMMVRHVGEAGVAYVRGLGLTVAATTEDHEGVCELRHRVSDVLRGDALVREGKWRVRYPARRIGWHARDHAFEVEDRST